VRIDVLLKKEEIIPEKLKGQIVIGLDVLLATTTIAAALESGAKEVIPVQDESEAIKRSVSYHPDTFILIGEKNGRVLNGFIAPNPTILTQYVKGKTVLLATTNGTVALRRSAMAESLYAATLRNGKAVVNDVVQAMKPEQQVTIVCSGSQGQFCLEDFYGAGYLVSCLEEEFTEIELTDSARAAALFYRQECMDTYKVLANSAVGQFLLKHDCKKDLEYVAQENCDQRVPVYHDGHIVWKEEKLNGTIKKGNEGWSLPH
jgi:2-phosphosulfolactate phosphatase